MFARLDPLKASYLLSRVSVLFFDSGFNYTVPDSGNWSLSMYALNSYKFLLGGSQWMLQWKFIKPCWSIAFLIGTKHCLCFRALSPSNDEVWTKNSPFSAEDRRITMSAGKCSPSSIRTRSPHFISAHFFSLNKFLRWAKFLFCSSGSN